jgi:hypothetical protein
LRSVLLVASVRCVLGPGTALFRWRADVNGAVPLASGQLFPQLTIMPGMKHRELMLVELQPLLYHCRVLDREMNGFARESLELAPTQGRASGRDCVILHFNPTDNPDARPLLELWVDPSRDCCIARTVTRRRGGDVMRQIDVEHERMQTGAWIPNRWKHVSLDPDGGTRTSEEAEVTRVEVGPVAPAVFQIDAPAGTVVMDTRVNPPAPSVIREDGVRRPLTEREILGSLDEMLERARRIAREGGWREWVLPGALAALALACVIVARRRWLRRRRQAV